MKRAETRQKSQGSVLKAHRPAAFQEIFMHFRTVQLQNTADAFFFCFGTKNTCIDVLCLYGTELNHALPESGPGSYHSRNVKIQKKCLFDFSFKPNACAFFLGKARGINTTPACKQFLNNSAVFVSNCLWFFLFHIP